MMKALTMKKEALSALLCLAAVLTASACGETSETVGETVTQSVNTEAVTEAVTEVVDTRVPLGLPDADFGGYKLRILEYDPETNNFVQYSDFNWTKENAGELINDAVSVRNMMIEDRYNCEIEVTYANDTVPKAKSSITAGSDDYDFAELYINDIMKMASEGMFYNFYDIPHLALDQDWWDSAIQRDAALFGKIHAMTGDISMQDEELNYCIYFNKSVAQENDIGDLYDVVRNNKWTLETFHELGKQVSRDFNGDGVRDENDTYGVLTDGGMLWLFYFTCGGTYAELDKDGNPFFTVGNERNLQVADALAEFFRDTDTVMWASKCSNAWTTLDKILMEDRALFRPGSIYDITVYRSMNNDFGILPYPKFDEAQAEYYHPIASHVCPALCIPVTNPDIDRTGFLLEALAYESRPTVTKAYYDVNLYSKLTRDNDSGDMLDIIFASKRYDICKVFDWGAVDAMFGTLANSKSGLGTLWAKKESAAVKAMEKTLAVFSEED